MAELTLVLIGLHGVMVINLLLNLATFTLRRRARSTETLSPVSVLVPARNEEHNLPRLMASFARQDHPSAEMVIYDDQSTDSTWDIIQKAGDPRIRGIRGGDLPEGWVGKRMGAISCPCTPKDRRSCSLTRIPNFSIPQLSDT